MTGRHHKRRLVPRIIDDKEVPDLCPAMYEIRWPQRRWINAAHVTEWYQRALRSGHILDSHANCRTTSEMAEALYKSGCLVLTGNTKP